MRGFREELEKVNAYVRNRTHRLQYRDLIRRCTGKRIGKRRRLLNERESKLLHHILDTTEPTDPFSNDPARETSWDELLPFLDSLYAGKTERTIVRELVRLQELSFLRFEEDAETDERGIVINFEAIGRY